MNFSQLMLAVIFISSTSHASEYFHQVESGHHEVTPSVEFGSGRLRDRYLSKMEVSRTRFSSRFDYGLSEKLALGARFSILKEKYSPTSGTGGYTVQGFENLEFNLNGTHSLAEQGAVKYGFILSFSPEKQEVYTDNNRNALTGGHMITPHVGFEKDMWSGVAGAKLAQDVRLGDREAQLTTSSTNEEYSGYEKTELALFYEHTVSENKKLGFQLSSVMTSDEKVESSGGGSTEAISPIYNWRVYMPMNCKSGVFTPELSYVMTTDSKVEGQSVGDYHEYGLKLSYRLSY